MKLDYIPLASVPTAESLGASAKVLVVDDGEIKKTAKANVGEHPSGKLTITGTSEVNCAAYATAQVSDENLVAGNIKKDVVILGTTGSYEGGGGSSDFTTAEVTVTNSSNNFVTLLIPNVVDGEGSCIQNAGYPEGSSPLTLNVPMYKGVCFCADPFSVDGPPVTVAVTGDITWNGEMMALTITGDGTITLSPAQS